jgi:hypothetical protein
MQCYRPVMLTFDNYYFKRGIKNNKTSMFVPCGKCLACLSQKSREWTMRLSHEWSYYNERNSIFLTLTYDNQHLPDNYSLNRRDVQLYLKRLRKAGLNFKYLCAGEYGFKYGRPHYHLIVFGIRNENHLEIRKVNKSNKARYKIDKLLYDKWNKGGIVIGYCSKESIQYCSQYTLKGFHTYLNRKDYFLLYKREKPYRVMSKGIGKRYALDNKLSLYESLYILYNNIKVSIPRSYLKWIDKSGLYIIDKIKEYSLIKADDDIQTLYSNYNITPMTMFDFYDINDYYDISKHPKLYKIFQNRCLVKEFKYISRHEKYLNKKLGYMSLNFVEEIA